MNNRKQHRKNSILDLRKLQHTNMMEFRLSAKNIKVNGEELTREKSQRERDRIISEFNGMIAHHELPHDKSFAKVLSILRKAREPWEAIELFKLLQNKTHLSIADQVIGEYSHSAMLEAFHAVLKYPASLTKEKIARLTCEAIEFTEICLNKYKNDNYIITNAMAIYSITQQYDKGIVLFRQYEQSANPKIDLPLRSTYISMLIRDGKDDANTNESEKELITLIKEYEEIRVPRYQDKNALRVAFGKLITFYYRNQQINDAFRLFAEGIRLKLYDNNQFTQTENGLKLNFHISQNYKKEEGGLSLDLAIVAFLYFIKTISNLEIHSPAIIVTGGHDEKHTKLKTDFPVYLKENFGTAINWNPDNRIKEFTISYPQIRKIRFMEEASAIKDQKELDQLIRSYFIDLRHDNEKRPMKYFSKRPKVPSYFPAVCKRLANDCLNNFDKRHYDAAENNARDLIQNVPDDPWGYEQLGWILHRRSRFAEAITVYTQAINLPFLRVPPEYPIIFSEISRKMGWAFNHLNKFKLAIQHYKKAIRANPNNCEIYNNWGITLKKKGKIDKAIEKFLKVYRKNPLHDECCIHLGNCFKQLEKFEEAEKYYQVAIQRSQKYDEGRSSAWAFSELGNLYLLMWQKNKDRSFLEKAIKSFTDSLAHHPDIAEALEGLSKLYELGGNHNLAANYRAKLKNVLPYSLFTTRKNAEDIMANFPCEESKLEYKLDR